jgi:hypothetical protein
MVGVQQRTDLEPVISPLDRPRILASLDAALTSRSAGLRRRLLQAAGAVCADAQGTSFRPYSC